MRHALLRLLLLLAPFACSKPTARVALPTSPPPSVPLPACELVASEPRSEAGRADLERCRRATDGWDPRAAFILSRALRANPDLPRANEWLHWLKRAAELGHPVAQFDLASHLLAPRSGLLAQPDRGEVLQLLRNSGCAGFPPALEALRADNHPLDPTKCPPPVLDLDGVWEGTLAITARHRNDGPNQEPVSARIEIGAGTVRVDVRSRGAWQTIMAEQFQVRRLGSTAVLHGIHDGWDDDGRFVEAWVFTLTSVDHDRLRAVYHRMVNNNHLPRDHREAVWWYAAAGDLVRGGGAATAKTPP